MRRVEDVASAKINLFLHVGDKRADGFHPLQSLAVFATMGDLLSFEESDDLSLTLDGPFASGLSSGDDNLILKAARALAEKAGIVAGAKITLCKYLPIASGIGGGSADAAATLRGLSQLWRLDFSYSKLRAIGATLGSDVPVCVDGWPAWMEGRGEILTRMSFVRHCNMILVNPGVAVSTADVFRALRNRRGVALDPPKALSKREALLEFLNTTTNDLEAPAITLQPIIAEVLREIRDQPGTLLARMSGSGATCFALFDNEKNAQFAVAALRREHPAWWTVAA